MARVKMDIIEKDVRVFFEKHASPAPRSRALETVARAELKKAQDHNGRALGRVPMHDTFVDGQETTNLSRVKPDGEIRFEFDVMPEVFAVIGELLVLNSPVKSGRYRESFVFFADGEPVDPGQPVPPADEYVFTNIQPYARRIERGWSEQTPEGVFQVVVAMVATRYRNLADIRFGYRSPIEFGPLESWANRTSMPSPGRTGTRRAEWLRRQPSIIIRMR